MILRVPCSFLGAALLALAIPEGAAAAPADEPTIGSTNETSFDNVELLDSSLNGRLSVVSVGSDRTKTNLLSIFATLKNLTSSSVTIEAETLYKDGDGNWIKGAHASWLKLELKPHEEMDYRSASLSEDAQDFLVRIRRPSSP